MIKETKDVVVLVARVANGVSKAMEDGKITLLDAVSFGPAAMAFLPAIAGCSAIPTEIMSATEADKEELLETFCAEFKISSAAAEAMVEQTLAVVVGFWKLFNPKAAAVA